MVELTAGCFQFAVAPADVEANLALVEASLPRLADEGCRLLVLPEMWSCGFCYPHLTVLAEKTPEVLGRLSALARRYGMVLVGSLPEGESARVFNTSYVMDATGELVGKYRKIHLFSLHGEQLHFGRGTSPLICSTRVGRLGLMICYDIRFPELARRMALDGAQILCVSALWPLARIEHWSLLLRCRALENQLFVVGCNGCGQEGTIVYGGSSAVISPTGVVLAEAGDGPSSITASLDPETMRAFREQISCFPDRLPGIYGID